MTNERYLIGAKLLLDLKTSGRDISYRLPVVARLRYNIELTRTLI